MRRILFPFTLVVAALLTACGSNTMVAPVVPTPTAAPTAGPVTVKALGTVVAGVDVLLSDASGAPVAQTRTDAAGEASFMLAAGAKGMVTLISSDGEEFGFTQIETFMDMGPGDKIQTYVAGPQVDSGTFGSFVIELADRAPEGTVAYSIDIGCASRFVYQQFGDRLQGWVFDVPVNCPLGPGNTVDVMVTALNGDFLPLAFSTHASLVIAPNTKTPATFPDGWRTGFVPFPFAYKNVPAGFTLLNPSVISQRADGSGLGSLSQPFTVAPGDSGARTLLYARDFVTKVGYSISLYANDHFHGPSIFYARLPANPVTSATVDLATDLPPIVTDMSETDGATFRPGAAWTTSGDVSKMDIGAFSLNWKRGKDYVSWTVYFPPTTASPVQVPEIPDSLALARPTGDGGTVLGSVTFISDSTNSGYHDYIGAPFGYKPTDDVTYTATTRNP
jgi:hypothetical protein